MINWRVRFRNAAWVRAFVAQLILAAQGVVLLLNFLGVTDFKLTDVVAHEILAFVDTVCAFLVTLGIIQDPTTKGIADSERAMEYLDPADRVNDSQDFSA